MDEPGRLGAGWGINVAHQGNTIFATWFTYDVLDVVVRPQVVLGRRVQADFGVERNLPPTPIRGLDDQHDRDAIADL